MDPCNWDNLGSCKECQKKRCASCAEDKICAACEEKIGTTACFALCTDDLNVCRGQKSIDFGQWNEMYIAVRCMRDRYVAKRDRNLFPGFCKQHNEENISFVQAYWNSLEPWQKLLLTYMIDGNTCSIKNFDSFVMDNQRELGPVTTGQIVHLLLTPAAITAVNHVYIQAFIDLKIQQETFVKVFEEFSSKVVMISTLEEKNALLAEMQARMQTPLTYEFVIDGILQPATVQWLCGSDKQCIRLLRWNHLLYKINMAFIFSFYPLTIRSSIPRFSADWKAVWMNRAAETMQKYGESFTSHFQDFIVNIESLTITIEDSFQQIVGQDIDDRPIPNVQEYLGTLSCEQKREYL
jgi:hypothetical protein